MSNTEVRPDEKPSAIQRPSGLQQMSRTVPVCRKKPKIRLNTVKVTTMSSLAEKEKA